MIAVSYNYSTRMKQPWRLSSLILLIAIAYSCAVIQGQKIKTMGVPKYVGRLVEYGRSIRRPSSFWIGLYGQYWVIGMECKSRDYYAH